MTTKPHTYLLDEDPEIELMDRFVYFLHANAEKTEKKAEKTEGEALVNLL